MNWESSILWGIVGLVGGFLISLLFYFVGIKRRRLAYVIQTVPIVSEKVSQVKGLDLKYNGIEIETLYSSTITVKNVGNSIVEKADIAPLHPLSISTKGIFLIDKENGVQIVHRDAGNEIVPRFRVNEGDGLCSEIIVDFDYIPKKNEFQCSIFHTGDITLNGVLKEGNILDNKIIEEKKRRIMRILDFIIPIIASIISVILTEFLK